MPCFTSLVSLDFGGENGAKEQNRNKRRGSWSSPFHFSVPERDIIWKEGERGGERRRGGAIRQNDIAFFCCYLRKKQRSSFVCCWFVAVFFGSGEMIKNRVAPGAARFPPKEKWRHGNSHRNNASVSIGGTLRETKWLFARLPHIKCIRLGSVRSSHLPFKMYSLGLRAFKSPYSLYMQWLANSHDPRENIGLMHGFLTHFSLLRCIGALHNR